MKIKQKSQIVRISTIQVAVLLVGILFSTVNVSANEALTAKEQGDFLEAQYERREISVAKEEERVINIRGRLSDQKRRLAKARSTQENLTSELAQVNQSIEKARLDIETHEIELVAKNAELAELQEELAQAESQLTKTEDAITVSVNQANIKAEEALQSDQRLSQKRSSNEFKNEVLTNKFDEQEYEDSAKKKERKTPELVKASGEFVKDTATDAVKSSAKKGVSDAIKGVLDF